MYAVVETGGKQYRVSPGQTVEVELLPAEPGATVALDRVLLVSTGENTLVGRPIVAGASVVATVAREGRGDKIIVFKYKSKKRYRRTRGHRQYHSYLLITDIQAEGESLVADDDRRRFENQAARMAARYQRRLEASDALAYDEAIGDAEAVARDEELIEDEGAAAEIPETERAVSEPTETAEQEKPAEPPEPRKRSRKPAQ